MASMRTRRERQGNTQTCPARAEGETSQLMRWRNTPGVELLHGDYHHHAFLPHWHDTYMLASSEHGPARYRVNGQQHLHDAGTLAAVHPGELHQAEAIDPGMGWHFRVLYLSENTIRDALGIAGNDKPIHFSTDIAGAQGQHLLQLHRDLRLATTQLERDSLLALALPQFFSHPSQPMAGSPLPSAGSHMLDRVRDYLHVQWQNACALEDLSAIAGLSRFHLVRSFRQRFGLPPHAYQMQLRVTHAKELLFAGMAPTDVALETGFYDQAHLTNTLRRYAGATPGRLLMHAQ
jgi:AraC-like DNA-binding protein